MVLAQVGPLTTLIEAGAAAVGAGAILSSAAAGAWGLAAGKSKEEIEQWALKGGYLGGELGAFAACLDIILRYFPS
jgi:hypothetical protein